MHKILQIFGFAASLLLDRDTVSHEPQRYKPQPVFDSVFTVFNGEVEVGMEVGAGVSLSLHLRVQYISTQ